MKNKDGKIEQVKTFLGKLGSKVADLKEQAAEQVAEAGDKLNVDGLKDRAAAVRSTVEDNVRATPLGRFLPDDSGQQGGRGQQRSAVRPDPAKAEARRQAEGSDSRPDGQLSPTYGEPAGSHNSLQDVADDAMARREEAREPRKSPPPSASAMTKRDNDSASDSAGTAVKATAKKAAAKPAAQKTSVKKAKAKKAVAKSISTKKTTAKKTAAKKTAAKKTAAKKAAAKKAAVKKTVARKAADKKRSVERKRGAEIKRTPPASADE